MIFIIFSLFFQKIVYERAYKIFKKFYTRKKLASLAGWQAGWLAKGRRIER